MAGAVVGESPRALHPFHELISGLRHDGVLEVAHGLDGVGGLGFGRHLVHNPGHGVNVVLLQHVVEHRRHEVVGRWGAIKLLLVGGFEPLHPLVIHFLPVTEILHQTADDTDFKSVITTEVMEGDTGHEVRHEDGVGGPGSTTEKRLQRTATSHLVVGDPVTPLQRIIWIGQSILEKAGCYFGLSLVATAGATRLLEADDLHSRAEIHSVVAAVHTFEILHIGDFLIQNVNLAIPLDPSTAYLYRNFAGRCEQHHLIEFPGVGLDLAFHMRMDLGNAPVLGSSRCLRAHERVGVNGRRGAVIPLEGDNGGQNSQHDRNYSAGRLGRDSPRPDQCQLSIHRLLPYLAGTWCGPSQRTDLLKEARVEEPGSPTIC